MSCTHVHTHVVNETKHNKLVDWHVVWPRSWGTLDGCAPVFRQGSSRGQHLEGPWSDPILGGLGDIFVPSSP